MDRNGGENRVCREFLRGECDRGDRCKFSHPDLNEGGGGDELKSRVCRDYLRDECVRGDKCIYQHPPGQKGSSKAVKFCHNFQNGRCRSQDCSYLHCSSEEEVYYKETGKLPPGMDDMVKNMSSSKICKDFLNGKCFRQMCKFVHTDTEYQGGPPRKRPMPSWDNRNEFYPPPREERERMRSLVNMVHDLEDENVVLRHKLSRIHRQVLDLTDDNKILLDDNRRLRGQSDAESLRPAPRRPDAVGDVPSLDSYLRERAPAVASARAAAIAHSEASGPRAGGAGYEADRLSAYNPEHPTPYEGRLSARYDY